MTIAESPGGQVEQRFEDEFDGGRPMTILEHLQELRVRLIWCCLALIVAVVISAFFVDSFLEVLVRPMEQRAPEAERIFTNPLEAFTTKFKIILYAALIIGMPMFVYQTLMFVLPGLTPKEKRWVLPIVAGVFFALMCGVAFAYYVTLPPALAFLLNIDVGGAKAQIKIGEYISFVTRLLFWVGLSFETPIIILALARFGLITGRQLLGWWRYMIVVLFLVAAVVTPTPDPITQALVAGPLLVLYLLGILLAFLFGRDVEGRGRRTKWLT